MKQWQLFPMLAEGCDFAFESIDAAFVCRLFQFLDFPLLAVADVADVAAAVVEVSS
jgi:hypothetical protein